MQEPTKRRGRPAGTPNPNAGRKPTKTWEQRHMEDPEGSATVLLTLPNDLGWWLEARAKQEGVSIPALLVAIAQDWRKTN